MLSVYTDDVQLHLRGGGIKAAIVLGEMCADNTRLFAEYESRFRTLRTSSSPPLFWLDKICKEDLWPSIYCKIQNDVF